MARSLSLRDYVDELTKCPICLEDTENPKSLPCLHTFCLRCIKDFYKDNLAGDEVGCPMCRTAFAIPRGGVERLTSNFFIKDLIEVKKTSSGKPSDNVPCDVCREYSDLNSSSIPNATMYCNGCGQRLCLRCSRTHQKIPGGTHQVVAFGANIQEDLLKLQGSFCSSHSSNKLEIYCNDCHLNICVTCHVLKHKKHDCHDISDIYQEFSKSLKFDIEQVTSEESIIMQELNRLEQEQEMYFKKIQHLEKAIHENAAEIRKRIDATVTQLMKELSERKSLASKITRDAKDQLEFAVAASRSFTRYSRELLDKGKPCDVTHAYSELHKRADELLKRDVTSTSCSLPEVTVTSSDVQVVFDAMSRFILEKSKSLLITDQSKPGCIKETSTGEL
jgi:hypothetical protein